MAVEVLRQRAMDLDPAELGYFEKRPGSGIWSHPDSSLRFEPRTCEGCQKTFMAQRARGQGRFCTCRCANARLHAPAPGYGTRHSRVHWVRGTASAHTCTDCGQPAHEWSQVHGTDGLDIFEHYVPRCRSCHRTHDCSRGEQHYNAKLTEARVRGIRASVGATYQELAEIHGVSHSLIGLVQQRKVWKHVS